MSNKNMFIGETINAGKVEHHIVRNSIGIQQIIFYSHYGYTEYINYGFKRPLRTEDKGELTTAIFNVIVRDSNKNVKFRVTKFK